MSEVALAVDHLQFRPTPPTTTERKKEIKIPIFKIPLRRLDERESDFNISGSSDQVSETQETEIPYSKKSVEESTKNRFKFWELGSDFISGLLEVLSFSENQEFDSATTTYINPQRIMDEIESLFISGREEFFEDGMESRFSKGLISTIEKYYDLAIDAISDLILSEKVSPEVASEALRWIGKIEHNATYENRLHLLEQSLKCSSAKVRDGAILGLSFLNDFRAIGSIKEAIQKENIKLLRRNMGQVLEQLEGEL
jgi:hypothetical protein